MKKILSLGLGMILLLSIISCSGSKKQVIKIAHKNYTEQRLLGQVVKLHLESKGFACEVNELAGTILCFNSLKGKTTDVYVEYTGSGYGAVLKQTKILNSQETYDYVKKEFEKKFKITWLEPLGFNNTYVLSVRDDTAQKYNLKTISDLIPHAHNFVLGSDMEFLNRVDGMVGLKKLYTGLKFKDEKSMDQGLTYVALANGNLDVNSSYSTDGRISKFGFVNLIDDKHFFPNYYATPIMRMDYAKKNPKVYNALMELGNRWTEQDLQKYNLMVDEGGNIEEVAREMLALQ